MIDACNYRSVLLYILLAPSVWVWSDLHLTTLLWSLNCVNIMCTCWFVDVTGCWKWYKVQWYNKMMCCFLLSWFLDSNTIVSILYNVTCATAVVSNTVISDEEYLYWVIWYGGCTAWQLWVLGYLTHFHVQKLSSTLLCCVGTIETHLEEL